MIARARSFVRVVVGRCAGERALPVGGVARDRRVLRRALAGHAAGRVLVLGPGLATRQVLAGAPVDVAGTSPHSAEVTVCSAAHGAGSLPPDRWDTVIIMEPGPDFGGQLAAVRAACRAKAHVLVVDRAGWDVDSLPVTLLAEATAIQQVTGKGLRRVWLGQVRA